MGARGISHPSEDPERGQYVRQNPHQPRDLGIQTNSTSWSPSKLVELTAQPGSPTQVRYFPCQQPDLCNSQATRGGLAEPVPFRSELQLPGEVVDFLHINGLRYPIQETNQFHDQDRAVEHTCTVLEQEQRLAVCNQYLDRQVSTHSAVSARLLILLGRTGFD